MSALWEPETQTADGIQLSPFGTIEATNLQDAFEELVGEQNSIIYIAQTLVANQLGAL